MSKITLLFFLAWFTAVTPSWAWKFAVIADTRGFHTDPQDPAEEWVNKRDPGVRTRVLSKISADIVAQGCELVIFPGDLIMGGPQSSGYYDVSNQYDKWRTAMASVISAGIPIYPVRGNHEWYGDEDGDQWWNQFGQYLPQNGPADYDGDGKTDPTVYSEAAGRWQTKFSSANYLEIPVSFGGADYLPAVGDYDGDGKADPAVYSASAGSWIVMLSSRNYAATTLP